MDYIKIRGHPPWYARGTPLVKLRDGPLLKIRGKPPFVLLEVPKARGKPPDDFVISKRRMNERSVIPELESNRFLTAFEMTAFLGFFIGKNSLYSQWSALLRRRKSRFDKAHRDGSAALASLPKVISGQPARLLKRMGCSKQLSSRSEE